MRSQHTKLLILIALLAVWALIFGFHAPWQPAVTSPAPGPAAPARTPQTKGQEIPRLKTDLLQLPPPTYTSETQSIFGTPPPPPPPPPPPRPVAGAGAPAVPPPPPPDPFQEEAKRLRYVGFLRRPERTTAFIIQGQEVHTLDIGATLGNRFRVQAITEDAVLLTSPAGDKQVRLPLLATTAPGAALPGAVHR